MSRESSLVTAQWVEDHLDDHAIVLIEVDEDTTAYDKGHIRGAIKLDWTTDLQDQVRRDFVNKQQLEALLSDRGISNDDTVVLYGGNNNWELDGRELTDEPVKREPTSYTAQDQDLSIRAFRDEVVDAIGTKNLIDV